MFFWHYQPYVCGSQSVMGLHLSHRYNYRHYLREFHRVFFFKRLPLPLKEKATRAVSYMLRFYNRPEMCRSLVDFFTYIYVWEISRPGAHLPSNLNLSSCTILQISTIRWWLGLQNMRKPTNKIANLVWRFCSRRLHLFCCSYVLTFWLHRSLPCQDSL